MALHLNTKGSVIGGVLAAVGASACCVLPLVLVTLGIGGTWVSTLTALEPFRPLFIALALGFFSMAGYRMYRQPGACAPGDACAAPGVSRRQRAIFWSAVPLVAALIAFPWFAPFWL